MVMTVTPATWQEYVGNLVAHCNELLAEYAEVPSNVGFNLFYYGESDGFQLETVEIQAGADLSHLQFRRSTPRFGKIVGGGRLVYSRRFSDGHVLTLEQVEVYTSRGTYTLAVADDRVVGLITPRMRAKMAEGVSYNPEYGICE